MEMLNRKKGYTDAVGRHTYEKLTKFRYALFQLLVNMYELIAENKWLLEWKDNSVVEDQEKRMQIFHLRLIPNLIPTKGGILY